MSNFLVNLARRGAGLPAPSIQTPPSSPFGPEIGTHVENVTETHRAAHDFSMPEESATETAAPQDPSHASSSEERVEPSAEVPIQHTPTIQRLSGTEPSTPNQSSAAEPATTIKTPLVEPPPVPRSYVLSSPLESEDITKIEVERDLHAPSSVGHDVEVSSQPASHSSSLVSAAAMVLQEPSDQQDVTLPERSPERPRIAAQPIPVTALPIAMVRPALTESFGVHDLPRVPAGSPPTPSAPLPIHVRIGRVEVRATTASPPTPARPSSPGLVGFDAYYRMRNYRS
jgi:hypothetical protein